MAWAPSTAPGALDSIESRRFFQQRLALVTSVLFVLFAAATVISFIASAFVPTNGMPTPIRWWGPQMGALLVLGGAWIYCRGGTRPAWMLTAIDVFVPIKLGLVVVLMIRGVPTVLRPELGIVLGMTHALVARAALVPSTAARSAIIRALAWLPPIVGTYQAYAKSGHPLLSVPPAAFAFVVFVWASLATLSTAVTSRVIYGLHQEARVARHLGQYTLDAKIGEGGMGVVYRARHAMLRRPTAIKLLSPDRAGETDFRRFEREVQLTSQLTHP